LPDAWQTPLTVNLLVKGQTKSCPGNTFGKSASSPEYGGYGALQVPCRYAAQPGGVSSGGGQLTYIDNDGNPQTATYTTDAAGNITEMKNAQNQTIPARPWGKAEISFDNGETWHPFLDWWPPFGSTTQTGNNSTCAYWYRGVYYDFCED
jgi:hypothetical protein